MKESVLEAKIEAILFTMGEAVELERIAAAVQEDTEACRQALKNMMKQYEKKNRGIQIIELDGAFQMCTKAPVILTSRSDTFETKVNSIALAAVVAENLKNK